MSRGFYRCVQGLLLLFVASVAVAQSSDDLRSRFGAPTAEQFMAHPKIALKVAYAADGQVCQLAFAPPRPMTATTQESETYMPTDVVSSLIDELVPLYFRTNVVMSFATHSGCNVISVTQYEKVTITRSEHNCEPDSPDREMGATVTYKSNACLSVVRVAAPSVRPK